MNNRLTPDEILSEYQIWTDDATGLEVLVKADAISAMREYAAQFEQKWLPESNPPKESGRYWCYVEVVNTLGIGHHQRIGSYNAKNKTWAPGKHNATPGRVTHWTFLLEPPQTEEL